MENNTRRCYFCSEPARYTCPRCALPYCSKLCYQSENHIECSESFYKECVEEELRSESSVSTGQRQMLEILNTFQRGSSEDDSVLLENADSDDDDDFVLDLSERMQDVNLNDADEIWDRLTEEEKTRFNTVLKSGEIAKLIPDYEPWWNQSFGKKIEDLDTFTARRKEYKETCPVVKEGVPFHTLCKVQPYRHILWNIVNVLSSYILVVRRYIGEHHNDLTAAESVINLSSNLKSDQNFESKEAAVESVIHCAKTVLNEPCSEFETKILYEDVAKVLAGPESVTVEYYILAALSDVQELLSYALNVKKRTNQRNTKLRGMRFSTVDSIDKKIVMRSIKKLTFYMSWTNEFYKKNLP